MDSFREKAKKPEIFFWSTLGGSGGQSFAPIEKISTTKLFFCWVEHTCGENFLIPRGCLVGFWKNPKNFPWTPIETSPSRWRIGSRFQNAITYPCASARRSPIVFGNLTNLTKETIVQISFFKTCNSTYINFWAEIYCNFNVRRSHLMDGSASWKVQKEKWAERVVGFAHFSFLPDPGKFSTRTSPPIPSSYYNYCYYLSFSLYLFFFSLYLSFSLSLSLCISSSSISYSHALQIQSVNMRELRERERHLHVRARANTHTHTHTPSNQFDR